VRVEKNAIRHQISLLQSEGIAEEAVGNLYISGAGLPAAARKAAPAAHTAPALAMMISSLA
jgi:hypothetical protein